MPATNSKEPKEVIAGWGQSIAPILSLFGSMSTLICCAIPALLVSLGLGASLAGIISVAPWLSVIGTYKKWIFIGVFILLGISSLMMWLNRNAPCPIDPKQAKACTTLRKTSLIILIISWVIYAAGAFFAFLAADLLL